jgi:hypothetical protein
MDATMIRTYLFAMVAALATLLVIADEAIEELIAHLSRTLHMPRKCRRLLCMVGRPAPLPPVLLRWVLLPRVFGCFIELAPFVFLCRYRPSSNRHLCGFHNR